MSPNWAIARTFTADDGKPDANIHTSATFQTLKLYAQNQDVDELLQVAREAIEDENYNEALALYKRASQLQPDNALIFAAIGFAQNQLGALEESALAFQQATELDRQNPHLFYGLARVLAAAGRYEDAGQAYRRVISLDKQQREAYLGLGQVLEAEANWVAALQVYETLQDIYPRDSQAYSAAGSVLIKQEQFSDALKALQKAEELVPRDASVQVNLAIAWIGLGEPEQAQQALNNASQFSSADPQMYVNLGQIYATLERNDDALAAYRQALKIDPGFVAAHKAIGDSLLAEGDFLRAIVYYRAWIDEETQNPDAYYALAIALKGRGRPAEAAETLQTALRLYRQQGNQEGLNTANDLLRSLQ